jgi:hypothetical protein
MTKFNGYQSFVIHEAVENYCKELKNELAQMEKEGKNPIITQDYVDMTEKDILEIVTKLTKKEKR